MSYIHFKSAFDSNFDKVEFDGVSLPLAQLKRLICEKAKFVNNKQVDFDLEITNVDTNEVYQNENDQVLKNARVIFKRTLRSSMTPLRAKPAKVSNPISSAPTVTAPTQVSANAAGISTAHSQVTGVSTPVTMSSLSSATKTNFSGSGNTNPPASLNTPKATETGTNSLPKSVYDSLAPLNLPSKPVIYHENNTQRTAENIAEQKTQDESNLDEKAKLDLILQNSMNKTAGMDGSSANGGGQTNTTGTGFNYPRFNTKPWVRPNHNSMSMISMNNRVPPPNYVCTTCRKPGHFKQHCPEAEFMPRPEDRPKLPKGIPKSILRLAPPGATFSMQGAEGTRVMTYIEYEAAQNAKKDKLIFLTEEEEEQLANEKQQQALNDRVKIPDELKCPFGDHLIKDAVLVPCCGHFVCCDECIKQKISNDENIECPYEKCDQEIGSLSSITPFHETRKKVADYLNELKLKSSSSLVAAANQTSTAANAQNAPSSDPLFDMILSGINEPSKLTKTIPSEIKLELDVTPKAVDESNVKSDPSTSPKSGTESPLQDRKISSSIEQQQQQLSQGTKMSENLDALSLESDEKAKLSLSPMQQQADTKPAQFQPALLPTPTMIGLESGATKPPINKSLSPSNVTYESSSFVNRPYNPNQQYRPYIRPVTNMPQPNVGYPRPRMPIHPMVGGQFVPGGQNFTNQNIPPPPGPFMPRATYPRYGFDPTITNPMMPVLNYQAPPMVGQGPPMNMMPPNMGGILPNQQPPPLYASNQMTLQQAPSIQSLSGVAPMSQIPQGVLSEAEFYKMKERLMKEQEGDYSKSSSYSNKSRRYETRRSDSRSRSRSKSRKRSPRETRSRTRSRSRSRGRRGRYSPRSRSKSYTRSRSRSTDKYRKQSKPTSGRSNRSRSRSPGSSKKYTTSSSSASTKRRHSRSRTRSPSRGTTHKSRSRSPNRHKTTSSSAQKPPQNSTDQKEKKPTEKRPPVPNVPTSDSKKPESDETSKKKKKHSQNDEANINKPTTITTTSTLDDSEKKSADKSSKHKSKKKHKHKHHRSSRSPSNH